MSLGPPFDASGLARQRVAGAFVLGLTTLAIGWVLFGAGRSLGPGILVHVRMPSTGLLKPGAPVRLAGRPIGEVRGAHLVDASSNGGVEFDVFLVRSWASEVRQNSEVFVATPSVLGEAYLEVGAPRPVHGARQAPGEPIKDGGTLHGTPPPEIDQFLRVAEANVRAALSLLRETRPETDEFLTAVDALLARLSGLPADRGQLRRIRDQAVLALDSGRELFAALRDADAVARTRHIIAELSAIADRAGPEISDLGKKIDRAMTRTEALYALYREREPEAQRALAGFKRAVSLGERAIATVRALQHRIDSGLGTVGAFLADREMIDDLHETHRIIKATPLRFVWPVEVNTNRPVQKRSPPRE